MVDGAEKPVAQQMNFVYFDENSAAGYMDISAGGMAASTREELNVRIRETHGNVETDQQELCMIRETKSTSNCNLIHPTGQAKIDSAEKYFATIGVDYAKSSSAGWNL